MSDRENVLAILARAGMSDRENVMTIAILSFASGYMFAEKHMTAACFATVVTLYRLSSYFNVLPKHVESAASARD